MSAPAKTARFLSPDRISEIIWGSESDVAGAPSDSISEDEGGFEDPPGGSRLQPDGPTCSAQTSGCSSSSSASDEEEVFQSWSGQQVQTPSYSQWTRPPGPQKSVVHNFTGGPRCIRDSAAPHMSAQIHLAFSCCILRQLSLWWWWKLTDNTTITLKDMTRGLHPSLT